MFHNFNNKIYLKNTQIKIVCLKKFVWKSFQVSTSNNRISVNLHWLQYCHCAKLVLLIIILLCFSCVKINLGSLFISITNSSSAELSSPNSECSHISSVMLKNWPFSSVDKYSKLKLYFLCVLNWFCIYFEKDIHTNKIAVSDYQSLQGTVGKL